VAETGLTGRYEVIVGAEAAEIDGLGKLIVAKVQAAVGVTRTLTCPGAAGDLRHLPAVLHDREHRPIPLFHDAELHQHGPPPARHGSGQGDGTCQRSAGATVKDQPEQASRISRIGVKRQVTPEPRTRGSLTGCSAPGTRANVTFR